MGMGMGKSFRFKNKMLKHECGKQFIDRSLLVSVLSVANQEQRGYANGFYKIPPGINSRGVK